MNGIWEGSSRAWVCWDYAEDDSHEERYRGGLSQATLKFGRPRKWSWSKFMYHT
jgi:hypothetical protein